MELFLTTQQNRGEARIQILRVQAIQASEFIILRMTRKPSNYTTTNPAAQEIGKYSTRNFFYR